MMFFVSAPSLYYPGDKAYLRIYCGLKCMSVQSRSMFNSREAAEAAIVEFKAGIGVEGGCRYSEYTLTVEET